MFNNELNGTAEAELTFDVSAEPPVRTMPTLSTSSLAITASLALSACGGGGGGSAATPSPTATTPPAPSPTPTPTPAPTPTPTPAPTPAPTPTPPATPTQSDAMRFLSQASMGASRADIDRVIAVGYDAWLTEQFEMPRPTTHWDWLIGAGYTTPLNNRDGTVGFDPMMWRQLIASPDQLRQRVGMALLDFLVVGVEGIDTYWRQFSGAAYVDILMDNAFGNFRTILEKISTSAAMASFLTFLGNRKADTRTGSQPDENYARELMQLFTIGLVRLNNDGTPQIGAGGQPVETYTADDVSGLARVFTGWNIDTYDATTPDMMRRPLINSAGSHESGAKSFLGTTIPAGTSGPNSLRIALDAIFAHPNVPPFISKQLIQRLVTSNPAPGYVARVAAVFANDGTGVRGNLRAVVRAILTDSEARSAAIAATSSFGKLREPIMRLTGWARAFGVTSPSNAWAIGDTSSTANRIGQSPGRSPSVFNFFRPGYTPPNTPISNAGMVAPEFQITNEPSVVAYVNYMSALVSNGAGDAKPNYTSIVALAGDAPRLVAEVDALLLANLSTDTRTAITNAVNTISATATNGPANRAAAAILLTLASPEFIVQK